MASHGRRASLKLLQQTTKHRKHTLQSQAIRLKGIIDIAISPGIIETYTLMRSDPYTIRKTSRCPDNI